MLLETLSTYTRPVLASALYDLTAPAEGTTVQASVKWADGQGVYEALLAVAGSTATIYDAGGIIRSALDEQKISCGSFIISIGTHSASVDVVYCDRHTASPVLSKGAFLTMLPKQIYCEQCEYSVTSPVQDLEEPLRVAVVAKTDRGNIRRYDYQGNESPAQFSAAGMMMGSFKDLLDDIREIEKGKAADQEEGSENNAEANEPETEPELPVKLMALSVSLGKKSKTYFFGQKKPDLIFYFRNCFNAIEIMPMRGTVEVKHSVQNSKAISLGTVVTYDHTRTIAYKFRTAAISQVEADALAQLSFSKEVYVKTLDGDPVRIAITQNEVTATTERNHVNSVEISFEAQAALTLLHPETERQATGPEDGIFSSPYGTEFA